MDNNNEAPKKSTKILGILFGIGLVIELFLLILGLIMYFNVSKAVKKMGYKGVMNFYKTVTSGEDALEVFVVHAYVLLLLDGLRKLFDLRLILKKLEGIVLMGFLQLLKIGCRLLVVLIGQVHSCDLCLLRREKRFDLLEILFKRHAVLFNGFLFPLIVEDNALKFAALVEVVDLLIHEIHLMITDFLNLIHDIEHALNLARVILLA